MPTQQSDIHVLVAEQRAATASLYVNISDAPLLAVLWEYAPPLLQTSDLYTNRDSDRMAARGVNWAQAGAVPGDVVQVMAGRAAGYRIIDASGVGPDADATALRVGARTVDAADGPQQAVLYRTRSAVGTDRVRLILNRRG